MNQNQRFYGGTQVIVYILKFMMLCCRAQPTWQSFRENFPTWPLHIKYLISLITESVTPRKGKKTKSTQGWEVYKHKWLLKFYLNLRVSKMFSCIQEYMMLVNCLIKANWKLQDLFAFTYIFWVSSKDQFLRVVSFNLPHHSTTGQMHSSEPQLIRVFQYFIDLCWWGAV